jgi:hypothetical protein
MHYGADREPSEYRFWERLANEGNTVDSVRRNIDPLLDPDAYDSSSHLSDDQIPPISSLASALSLVTQEQYSIASQINEAVIQPTDKMTFLQGSARTGKTFTAKALIKPLELSCNKRLVCGTTSIAAIQDPRGTTLYSLFYLGTNKQFTVSFRSNIGRGIPLARHILAIALIIINEASKLTPPVRNRVSLTL